MRFDEHGLLTRFWNAMRALFVPKHDDKAARDDIAVQISDLMSGRIANLSEKAPR